MKILKGNILQFCDNPFTTEIEKSYRILNNSGLVIKNNKIHEIDVFKRLKDKYPEARVYDYGQNLISSGFIDCHIHYPQAAIISSYGERLLTWLNKYTFPEEIKFTDYSYSKKIASFTLDQFLKNGVTTMSSFCTTSMESVDAFFSEANKRSMSVVAGKTCMDRNAPNKLTDNVETSYNDSEKLINKWHLKGRLKYAISPRFAPTSTNEQLKALGQLWSKYPDCIMQTHLGEQKEEIEWVKELFPNAKDYLSVYEKYNLIGKNAIFGHSIYLTEREIQSLNESHSSIAHCPTSNMFIGSGLFNLRNLINKINIGIASDIGGGTSLSMFNNMATSYKIAQLVGSSIHPAQLHWLATMGSAKSLGLENQIGNIKIGNYADLIIIDLSSTKIIELRKSYAKNFWEEYFPTIMMGDDRAIKSTWVSGIKAF